MALAGIISSVLSLFDYNLRILMWIDSWGINTGWAIRIGLIVIGGVLFFAFKEATEETDAPAEATVDKDQE
ncbi:hypothetical protein [Maribacter sp. 2210JD10-5]|uniref:hypothetical protein n=1 Tax=Maribacter sp. 2210JD10-5 TaxID=3386272 RepID=UPI0039BD4C1A